MDTKEKGEKMSTKCVKCEKNERTGNDLYCDECRAESGRNPSNKWIGVDLDGTLAVYDGWNGPDKIGRPVPRMIARVVNWIKEGKNVRIFTARVAISGTDEMKARVAIRNWCIRYIGCDLPVTATKDYDMVELWDDRCVHVERNTGRTEHDE